MKILGLNILPHDGGFVIMENNKLKYIFEAERYFKIKKFRNITRNHIDELFDKIIEIDNDFDVIYYNYINDDIKRNLKRIKFRKINYISHHKAHAASSYFTSKFYESLIITLDGWGDDGTGFIFKGNKNDIRIVDRINQRFGSLYRFISEQTMKSINVDFNHDPSGKFMAYCSYGKYDSKYEDIIKYLIDNYNKKDQVDIEYTKNFAFTFQEIWINEILKIIEKYSYISNNLCLAGGCFLNPLLNYRIIKSKLFKRYHFIPNTNDSGISMGLILYGEKVHIDLPLFAGPKAFDFNLNLFIDIESITDMLINQKILGIFKGNMEIGPRALGNRSILCDPRNEKMKEVLNKRVKHREWFRPFGVAILKDDLHNFFDIKGDFPYMNVIGFNKTNKLKAVRHIDNSTRIQTVDERNSFLYKILKSFKRKTGIPALLNTSFNIQGQPIINWYSDAIKVKGIDKIIC